MNERAAQIAETALLVAVTELNPPEALEAYIQAAGAVLGNRPAGWCDDPERVAP